MNEIAPQPLPPATVFGPPEERPQWPARYGIWALIAALGTTIVASGNALLPILPIAMSQDKDVSEAIILFTATVVQDAIFILAAISFASVVQPIKRVQFGLRRVAASRAIKWILIGFAIYVPFEIFWFSVVVDSGGDKTGNSLVALILLGILVVAVAPVAEEFLFRGFMFQAFRNRIGFWLAAILNGLLFGALHIGTYDAQDVLPLAVFGFAACAIFQRTNSLYPCVSMHAINNGAVFVLALL